MPLKDDDIIGHNHDGSFNEDYCKWCYADGTYTYNDMDDLIEVCVKNMVSENFTEEQAYVSNETLNLLSCHIKPTKMKPIGLEKAENRDL